LIELRADMPRLIDARDAESFPAFVKLEPGDVLCVDATGVRPVEGRTLSTDVVSVLGPFTDAVATASGEVVAPVGAPHTILIVAKDYGQATLELVLGDPWHQTRTAKLDVQVAPSPPRD
jgi:hypothetical protein